jgi:hypothetical protein
MTIEVQVFLPGENNPVDLDTYADIVAAIAGCGTYEQAQSLPDYYHYDNPKTGAQCTVESADMTRSN